MKDDEGWFGACFPQGMDELYFQRLGVMRNLDELRALFDLFSYSLHRLCHLGSAYENDPGVALWGNWGFQSRGSRSKIGRDATRDYLS